MLATLVLISVIKASTGFCQTFLSTPRLNSPHACSQLEQISSLTTLSSLSPPCSQLEQLSSMTTLSIDSGDLAVIEEFAQSGCISDATTNPLFVAQAGQSGDPLYTAMVDESVASAVKRASVGSR